MSKLQDYLIAAAVGMLMLGLGIAYERHQGAAACVAGDIKASAKQDTANAEAEGAAGVIVKNEGDAHEREIAAPVAPTPTVRMQPAPKPSHACKTVPAAGAGEELEPATVLPITGPSGSLRLDLDAYIKRNVQIGRDADSQVTGLQDYIAKVCQPPARSP